MRQAGKKKKRFKFPGSKKDEKKVVLRQLKDLLRDQTDGDLSHYDQTDGLNSGSESDGSENN